MCRRRRRQHHAPFRLSVEVEAPLTHCHLLHRRWTRCTRSTSGGRGREGGRERERGREGESERERVPLPPWSPFYPACAQLQQRCRDGRKERGELLTGSRGTYSQSPLRCFMRGVCVKCDCVATESSTFKRTHQRRQRKSLEGYRFFSLFY